MAKELPFSIRISAKIKDAVKGFNRLEKKIKGVSKSFKNSGRDLSTFVTLPVLGIGAAMYKAASDAEESQNRFNEVFKGIEKQATKTQQELSGSLDLSTLTAQQMLSDVGDLLTGIGLTRKESLGLGKDVIKLSADIASFKNVQGGAERVTVAVTKALLGEREMLKDAAKTAILESDVKKKANKILRERRDLNMQQAKALATLQILTERNAAAEDDYAETRDNAANQYRALNENLKDLAVLYGDVILPTVNELLKSLNRFMITLKSINPETRKMIVVFALVAAAIGPVLSLFGQLGFAIAGIAAAAPAFLFVGSMIAKVCGILIPMIGLLKVGFIALWGAIGGPVLIAAIAAIGALSVAGYLLVKHWQKIKDFFTNIFNSIIDKFMSLKDFLPDWIWKGGEVKVSTTNAKAEQIYSKAPSVFNNGSAKRNKSELTVDFRNMPKGVRVDGQSTKGTDLNINQGYVMGY